MVLYRPDPGLPVDAGHTVDHGQRGRGSVVMEGHGSGMTSSASRISWARRVVAPAGVGSPRSHRGRGPPARRRRYCVRAEPVDAPAVITVVGGRPAMSCASRSSARLASIHVVRRASSASSRDPRLRNAARLRERGPPWV